MTTHNIHKYTSIARPLEPDYPTNRAVLILAPVMGVIIAGLQYFMFEASPAAALIAFFVGALVAFLGWALARELAPDHEAAAFLALVVAPFGLLLGPLAILSLAAAMFFVRIVNRTVGPAATLGDSMLALVILALAMWADGVWALGLAAALAFLLDSRLDSPSSSRWIFALAALAMTAIAYVLQGGAGTIEIASARYDYLVIAGVITLGAALVAITQPRPVSVCDVTGDSLNRARVACGVFVAIVAGWSLALTGEGGLVAGIPIWAALAAAVEGRVAPKRKI